MQMWCATPVLEAFKLPWKVVCYSRPTTARSATSRVDSRRGIRLRPNRWRRLSTWTCSQSPVGRAACHRYGCAWLELDDDRAGRWSALCAR